MDAERISVGVAVDCLAVVSILLFSYPEDS
jgi:hypothetical protein